MIRHILPLTIAAVLSILAGCEEPPQVRKYRVAKSRSDLDGIRPTATRTAPARSPSRMVVAIAERDEATWFFKITGSVAAVDETEPQWTEMLKKLEYNEQGNPSWTLPPNWQQEPARPMRLATLTTSLPDSGSVEMSISSLGPDQELLSNVNRWRGQLSLPAIEEKDLRLRSLPEAAVPMQVFDAMGMLKSTSMPRPPEENSQLAYDVPDGWKKGQTNSMVQVRLTNGSGTAPTQITVTRLSAQFNPWLPNAQRWAEQVAMKTDEEFLSRRTTDVTIDGIEGKKILLIPESESDSDQAAMIGVLIVRGESAWFFKMIGDRDVVVNNQEAFEQFLNSFRFN